MQRNLSHRRYAFKPRYADLFQTGSRYRWNFGDRSRKRPVASLVVRVIQTQIIPKAVVCTTKLFERGSFLKLRKRRILSAEPGNWAGNRLLYGLCMHLACI